MHYIIISTSWKEWSCFRSRVRLSWGIVEAGAGTCTNIVRWKIMESTTSLKTNGTAARVNGNGKHRT